MSSLARVIGRKRHHYPRNKEEPMTEPESQELQPDPLEDREDLNEG